MAGDPTFPPGDRRGRQAILALCVVSAFLFVAALASALGVDLPFGDDEPTKDRSHAALPPEWRHIRPLRPLIPQREGSGVASADRASSRTRERARAERRDAAPQARASRAVRPPSRQARRLPRSVPVSAAARPERRLRVVKVVPRGRLIDLDSRVSLRGLTGSIHLDLRDLPGLPVGRGGVDIDIDIDIPDIDIDVDIPDIDPPDLPGPPGLPGAPGLPDLPGPPDLPGLPDLGRPTRSTGSPLSTGAVPARLTRTRDSSPGGARLDRVTSADGPGSDAASEGSPGSRSRDADRRRSEEVARLSDRAEELARVSRRRSARRTLEASTESPTTVAGGSGRVAGDCGRAPESSEDRDCAQGDRDRDRRERWRDEDDDRGREEDDRGREEDDPGTEPDGA